MLIVSNDSLRIDCGFSVLSLPKTAIIERSLLLFTNDCERLAKLNEAQSNRCENVETKHIRKETDIVCEIAI